MGVTFVEYTNREEWLKGRGNSIGASEIASVLGCGFCTAQELWAIKVGEKQPSDLSDNERVKYGNAAEEHLRALFALQYADVYEVEYHPYRVYTNEAAPFLTATLDGELIRRADGERGVWECKTAWIMGNRDLAKWANRLPDKYFCQVTSQMFVRDCKFAVLTAQLIMPDGTSEIRHYDIQRSEGDIKYLVSEAKKFWKQVKERKRPALVLTL